MKKTFFDEKTLTPAIYDHQQLFFVTQNLRQKLTSHQNEI